MQTTPRIEDNVLEATRILLQTELLPAIQNETASRMDDFENKLSSTTSALNEQSKRSDQIEETLTGKVDSLVSLVTNMQGQLISMVTRGSAISMNVKYWDGPAKNGTIWVY